MPAHTRIHIVTLYGLDNGVCCRDREFPAVGDDRIKALLERLEGMLEQLEGVGDAGGYVHAVYRRSGARYRLVKASSVVTSAAARYGFEENMKHPPRDIAPPEGFEGAPSAKSRPASAPKPPRAARTPRAAASPRAPKKGRRYKYPRDCKDIVRSWTMSHAVSSLVPAFARTKAFNAYKFCDFGHVHPSVLTANYKAMSSGKGLIYGVYAWGKIEFGIVTDVTEGKAYMLSKDEFQRPAR